MRLELRPRYLLFGLEVPPRIHAVDRRMQRDQREPEEHADGNAPPPDLGEGQAVAALTDRGEWQDRSSARECGPLPGRASGVFGVEAEHAGDGANRERQRRGRGREEAGRAAHPAPPGAGVARPLGQRHQNPRGEEPT
jgi:hypothetical protein